MRTENLEAKNYWPWQDPMTRCPQEGIEWPRITVVTPSYNQAAYLEETIRSVLLQKYPNLEYIVMDGGSSDGSVGIIKKYASRLSYWQSERDNGQADAIFRGFELSTGHILCWVNSDDMLLPGALFKVASHFVRKPESICVVGGCIWVGPDSRVLRGRRWNIPLFNLPPRNSLGLLGYWGQYECPQPAAFWRQDAFVRTGGFDRTLSFCFDYDMFLRFARSHTLDHMDEFLACYRDHDATKGNTMQDTRLEEDEVVRARNQISHAGVRGQVLRWFYRTFSTWHRRRQKLRYLLGTMSLRRKIRELNLRVEG